MQSRKAVARERCPGVRRDQLGHSTYKTPLARKLSDLPEYHTSEGTEGCCSPMRSSEEPTDTLLTRNLNQLWWQQMTDWDPDRAWPWEGGDAGATNHPCYRQGCRGALPRSCPEECFLQTPLTPSAEALVPTPTQRTPENTQSMQTEEWVPLLPVWGNIKGGFFECLCNFCSLDTSDVHPLES